MPSVTSADRATLEAFAARVIAEHQAGEADVCPKCNVRGPCSVEIAALFTGLVEPMPLRLVGTPDEWKVTLTTTEVRCETNWRRMGHGLIVVFDRAAVEAAEPNVAIVSDPDRRNAWVAARRAVSAAS